MSICDITEQKIKDAKSLADEIWLKHIDNGMKFQPDDAKNLINAIWLINGMYESDVMASGREANNGN